MPTNLITYCLGEVTDYSAFERFCHDLMSLEGYTRIEPLGGFSDKGRDAIHVSTTGETTVFAYSVREDWRAKLSEDADKIRRHGHSCDTLTFVTTADFSVGERDEAVGFIRDKYSWRLELYGLERLRVLLDAQYPHVKANHPSIFPPDILAVEAHVKKTAQRDHLFISYASQDAALAEWLTRKLTAEGYLVWCERFKLLGGESYPEDIDNAIHSRACRVIALYSQASLKDREASRQRIITLGISAAQTPNFVVPLRVDHIPGEELDHASRRLVFVPFETNWATGLQQLLQKLDALSCPKLLPTGRRVAAEAFLEDDVLVGETEAIVTNCLRVEKLPTTIRFFRPKQAIPRDALNEIKFDWAFRSVNDKFLSFQTPPTALAAYELKATGGTLWQGIDKVEGVATTNLVSELLRKSLLVYCLQRGLHHCSVTRMHYFPLGLVPGERLKYKRADGKSTTVNATGQRTYRRGSRSDQYRYHLSPAFSVTQNLLDPYAVLVRTRVRITDLHGEPLPRYTANARRKDLCKDWWNAEWLGRILAICQYLATNGKIVIGTHESEQIVIDAEPLRLAAPKGINEAALEQSAYERDELSDQDDEEAGLVTEGEVGSV